MPILVVFYVLLRIIPRNTAHKYRNSKKESQENIKIRANILKHPVDDSEGEVQSNFWAAELIMKRSLKTENFIQASYYFTIFQQIKRFAEVPDIDNRDNQNTICQ
jgi:hypothetical protein